MENIADFYGTATNSFENLILRYPVYDADGNAIKIGFKTISDQCTCYLESRGLNLSPTHVNDNTPKHMVRPYIGPLFEIIVPVNEDGTLYERFQVFVPCSRPSPYKQIDYTTKEVMNATDYASLSQSELDTLQKKINKDPTLFIYKDKIDENTTLYSVRQIIDLKQQGFRFLLSEHRIVPDEQYGHTIFEGDKGLVSIPNFDFSNDNILEAILPGQMIAVKSDWAQPYTKENIAKDEQYEENLNTLKKAQAVLPEVIEEIRDKCMDFYKNVMYIANTHKLPIDRANFSSEREFKQKFKDLFYTYFKIVNKEDREPFDLNKFVDNLCQNNYEYEIPIYAPNSSVEFRGLNFTEALTEALEAERQIALGVKLEKTLEKMDNSRRDNGLKPFPRFLGRIDIEKTRVFPQLSTQVKRGLNDKIGEINKAKKDLSDKITGKKHPNCLEKAINIFKNIENRIVKQIFNNKCKEVNQDIS